MVYNEFLIANKLNYIQYEDQISLIPRQEVLFKEHNNLSNFFYNFLKTNYDINLDDIEKEKVEEENIEEDYKELNKYLINDYIINQNLKNIKTYNIFNDKERAYHIKLEEKVLLDLKDTEIFKMIDKKQESLKMDIIENDSDVEFYWKKKYNNR